MSTTRMTRHAKASRESVSRALADARAVRRWQVPDGMASEVHELEVREGGTFRISLTYQGDVSRADNEHGWRRSLGKRARLVEQG